MLKAGACDRFLIHIIVKHVSELCMTRSGETTRKLLFTKSALVQFLVTVTGPGVLRSAEMGITSAGLQIRNANGGEHVPA